MNCQERSFTPELNSAVAGRIEKSRHIEFANEIARFHLSQLLYGEQEGVALAANLCSAFRDPGAQEYAANQVFTTMQPATKRCVAGLP